MSIVQAKGEKWDVEFTAVCDVCGDTLPSEEEFKLAVDAKKRHGWRSQLTGGEWQDLCTKCKEKA